MGGSRLTHCRICIYLFENRRSPSLIDEATPAPRDIVKAAELFVRCLENEGVEAIFGLPGEENVDILDVLLEQQDPLYRHPPRAGGRLHGRRLRPADRAGPACVWRRWGRARPIWSPAWPTPTWTTPRVVAISGQSATTRIHKESHQHLDLVNLFRPISKYARPSDRAGDHSRGGPQGLQAGPEREAGRELHRPARERRPDGGRGQGAVAGAASAASRSLRRPTIARAAEIIRAAKYPLIMAGNGVIRARAADTLLPLRRAAEHPRGQHLHGQGRDAVFPSACGWGRWACRPTTTCPAASIGPT